MAGVKSELNSAIKAPKKAVGETFQKASDDLSTQASDLGQRFDHLKERVLSTMSDEIEAVTEFTQTAAKQFPQLLSTVERTIRRHPITSAAVALGVGALAVSYITRDRSRSRTRH